MGPHAVSGGTCGASGRECDGGGNARQRCSRGGAAEHRRTGGQVQLEWLRGGTIGIAGHQIEHLLTGAVRRRGRTGDHTGSGIERKTGGHHPVGNNRQVVDRVAAEVYATVFGAKGKLPGTAVGGVHLARQIHVDQLAAVVADAEAIGTVELDLHRLGAISQGDGRLADESPIPAHLHGGRHHRS